MSLRQNDAPQLNFSEIVREFVTSARKAKGWTQPQLATAAKMPQSTIWYIEAAERDFSGDHLDAIIKALGLTGQSALMLMTEVARNMELRVEQGVENTDIGSKKRGRVRREAADALQAKQTGGAKKTRRQP